MLQPSQASCGASCIYLLLFVLLLNTVNGQWDPPCQSNCSWLNAVGDTQKCGQLFESDITTSVCPDKYRNNEGNGTAPPAEDIQVDYYVTTYPGYSESFTKLNISFDLNLNGSGIYTGAIIEIKNIAMIPNKLYCHYLNFEEDEINKDDLLTQENSIKRIFFDCTPYLSLGTGYLITIKTMPYTKNSKPMFEYYWTPSCFYRQDDANCKTLDADLPGVWSPSRYEADGRGHKQMELVFNLSPYDFDKYLVYFLEKELINDHYESISSRPVYCLNLNVENKNVTFTERCPSQTEFKFNVSTWKENNETFVQILWTDVREAVYFVEMQPVPTSQGQQCSSSHEKDCQITTKSVIVKARPCEKVQNPCPGDNMICVAEDTTVVNCYCETGFEKVYEKCVKKEDEVKSSPTEESGEVSSSAAPTIGNPGSIIAAVMGSLFGVLAVIFVLWLICKNQRDSGSKYMSDHEKCNERGDTGILEKRIFIIHSFDHKLHNEVILKLCIFLKTFCKFEVHTALWSTNEIGIGVNEWMNTECEEADKVIILCSQGTQIKWRAMSRQVKINVHEDTMGDLFSMFMRLQTPEFVKNPKKFIVAYMDYSTEEHIPQPLKFLQKFTLMNHVENMFFCLNKKEKQTATEDLTCYALKDWDSYSDAGQHLKEAINQMKKVCSDPDWFFIINKISENDKRDILTTQSKRDEQPNPDVSIIRIPGHSLSAVPIDYVSEDDYQMSNFNSLRHCTSQSDGSAFTSGFQSQNDSG